MIKKRKKLKRIIFLTVTILIMASIPIHVGLFSVSYNNNKGYPVIVDGIIDFNGAEISNTMGLTLAGDYKFYYNKWLVTDNEIGAQHDGYINIMDKWTSLQKDGKKLPKYGYGSYKFTMKNIAADYEFEVHYRQSVSPLKVFINGELYYQSCELSKTKLDMGYYGKEVFKKNIFFDKNTDYEVIIELSYTNQGGIAENMWFSPIGFYNNEEVNRPVFLLADVFNYVAVGLLLAVFLISIGLVLVSRVNKKDFATPTLVGTIMIFYFFSKDFFNEFSQLIRLDYGWIDLAAYFSTLLVIVGLILYLASAGIKFKWYEYVYFFAVCLISMIIYLVGIGYAYRHIGVIILALVAFPMLYRLSESFNDNPALTIISATMIAILLDVAILQLLNIIGAIHVIINGGPTFICAIFAVLVCLLYFQRVSSIHKQALAAKNLEIENKRIKKEALNAQIKPHFLFNMLNSIQHMYNNADVKQGNIAMQRFATHLRNNINADVIGTVNFAEEIKNIDNYFELENLRCGGKLNLTYDIGFDDFKLPILSLQPFVENAIKHAKTELKEDGYIMLSCQLEGDNIFIKIIDNGVGFDTSMKKATSVGISNCVERLRLDLDATVQITSVIDEGTKIEIIIPKSTIKEELPVAITKKRKN